MPFHWGLIVIFLLHLTVFLFPQLTLGWSSSPIRLIATEIVAFTFGLSALVGLVALFIRRISDARVKMVTNNMDLAIEVLLLAQIILGCWIAVGYRWGYSWFAADLSPYLWSIVKFSPDATAVVAMPIVIKLHIAGAFLVILMIPFTRLVHFLVAPFHYIWRPYQQVIWHWNKKTIRDKKTPWSEKRPFNN